MDIENQNMENMDSFMDEIDKSMRSLEAGEIIEGEIISLNNNEIILNINYKADGIIPKDELVLEEAENIKENFNINDKVKVCVLKINDGEGNVLLSKKQVDAEKGWEILEENFKNNKTVEATITGIVRGGVIAYSNGVRCFIPASHLSNKFTKDLNPFLNQQVKCEIITFDKDKNKVVLSRKNILLRESEELKNKAYANLEKNKIVKGSVREIKNFGAFIDLGGVDGLLHVSELSWGKVSNPSDVLKVGQELDVLIIDIDKENDRISLSLKQKEKNPWDIIDEIIEVNQIIKGRVIKTLDFGAFIEIKPGLDGLLHISEISNEHVEKTSDKLKIGDEIEVIVLGIDKENNRISLSMKKALEKVEEQEEEENVSSYSTEQEDTTIGDIIENK